MARDNKLTKSAGEHHVCSELARRGWAASLTRDGLARTDILAVHSETRGMIEVQVKAAGVSASWQVGEISPSATEREWFVMVHLGSDPLDRPRNWVIPRDHLSAAAWIGFWTWRNDPHAKRKRSAGVSAARVHPGDFEKYEDRWDLLDAATDNVPVLLPSWMRDNLGLTMLPEGHRWEAGPPEWA